MLACRILTRVIRNIPSVHTQNLYQSSAVAALHKTLKRSYCVEAQESETSETPKSQTQAAEASGERDPKDRSIVIPVETSIRYLKSKAYSTTYGEEPVWVPYKRNFKGGIPPSRTRKTCIKMRRIMTGSPCPICRDEYLVLHKTNVELLKQFISPYTGEVLGYSTTGLCQKQQEKLLIAIWGAREEGLITFDIPYRHYDYSLYRPKECQHQHQH